MKAAAVILAITLFSLSFMPMLAQALPTSGSLYISIPNASWKCANLVLPDDGGYFGPGAVDYIITMVPPDPEKNWGGITEQIVTTDYNNTVVVPLCFSSINQPLGNCSRPFVIRLSAPSIGLDKTWDAGMCASLYADFDTAGPSTGTTSGSVTPADPMTGLDDADVFSVGFSVAKQYIKPGETANFTLWVQSQAELELDFTVQGQGGIAVSPSTASLATGPDDSFHELGFLAGPMNDEKTYSFTVTAKASDCGSGSMCTRQATAELVVGQQPPAIDGFLVSVFPENINVKDIRNVIYRIVVNNFGDHDDEFSFDASLPDGVSSTFAPTTLTVPAGEYKTMTFTVTPEEQSQSYELDFTVTSSSGVTKPITSYLSTNEQLTDARRSLEAIEQLGNSDAYGQAVDDVGQWYRSYQGSGYGEDLQSYSDLQSGLQTARESDPNFGGTDNGGDNGGDTGSGLDDNVSGDYPGPATPGLELFGKDIWIILVAVLVVLGGMMAFLRFRKKKGVNLDEEIDIQKGF
jgi:hypothetical protein